MEMPIDYSSYLAVAGKQPNLAHESIRTEP